MNKLTTIVFLFVLHTHLWAQEVDQVKATLTTVDNKAHYQFTYRLAAGADNVASYVRLKIKIANGGEFYATKVSADVGEMVFPGGNKKILWDYGDELVHYNGAIDYSIEAEPMIAVPTTKKGKGLSVNVRAYLSEGAPFTVALYRNNLPVWTSDTQQEQSDNVLSVAVPKKLMKIKKGYQVVLSRGSEKYFSNTFRIKPRINRMWYALPLVAAAVPFVLQELEPDPPLPEPPEVEFD